MTATILSFQASITMQCFECTIKQINKTHLRNNCSLMLQLQKTDAR